MEGLILGILLQVAVPFFPRAHYIAPEDTTAGPHRIAPRQEQVGTYKTIRKVPVIIVSFSDWAFSNSKGKVDSMFNSDKWTSTYGGKSIREYFKSSSGGNYQPQFDIYGPVTLSHPYTYYYQISINWSAGTDTTQKNLAFYAAQEACEAINDTVDFSQYDGDGDGNIDLVYILYAGYGANDYNYLPETVQHPTQRSLTITNLIWPHYAHMSQNLGPFDGKGLYDYECSNELDGVMEAYYPSYGTDVTTGIGVATHEFSHALGLPDMYQTNGFDKKKRMGQWDIMDQGCYNNLSQVPASYSSWERWIMGWIEPIRLDTASNDTLKSLIKSNKAYYYPTDGNDVNKPASNSAPFYLLENRQKEGFDWCLPGHGLLMTKITYKSSYSTWQGGNNTEPFAVDIVEADGLAPSYSSTDQKNGYLGKDGDCFPTGAKRYVFSNGDSIANIQEENGVITFEYNGGYHNPCEGFETQTYYVDTLVCDTLLPYTWQAHEFETPDSFRVVIASQLGCGDSIVTWYRLDTVHCEAPEPEPTGVEENKSLNGLKGLKGLKGKKVVWNGQIVVEENGKVYDLEGNTIERFHPVPPRRIPAYPGEIRKIQSNGDTIGIYLKGDERSHYVVTADGYQIVEWNNDYYYARLKKGQVVRTDRMVKNVGKRSKKDQKWLKWHGIKH